MRTLVLVLLLLATPVYANTLYSYVGDTFHEATGAYALTDRISGSFTLADSFVAPPGAFGNFLSVEGVLGWSFTDGHQTFDQTNSTRAILGWWQDEGADRPTWSVSLANATGSLLTNTIHEWSDVGAMFDTTGQLLGYGRNDTFSPPWTLGTWTVQTIQTPELAIIHLPRLLKWGLGLGLEARVTNMLQHATAWTAATVLRAPRDGIFIDLPGKRIEVAEACSGIATLALLIAVGVLLAIVQPRMRWAYIVGIVVAAAALALEANALRVVLIALGGEHRDGIQYATTAVAVGQLVALARLCRTS